MKQKNLLKIALFFILAFSSTKINSQSAGDIAFIAYNGDGNDEFAFVALADIPANTSIWFTDNEWDGTDRFNNINEGEIEWTYTSILSAGSVVVIAGNSGGSASIVNGLGTVSGTGLNLGASNESLYALLSEPISNAAMPNPGFLAGIANDFSGDGVGLFTNTGLTIGTNFIDFSDDHDGYKYTGSKTGQASFANYLPLIMNTANWQNETSDGNLILPISTTSFVVGAAPPGITLGAVSGNTNEDGSTATFTVVLNAQPATDVVLNLSSGDTGEVTLDQATLTFTNGNWDTPQTVIATGVDDGGQDGNIEVTITVSVDDANSDDAYDPIADTTTTITNDDDELPILVINEVLADPDATTGDANGDGTVSTSDDEFVELYNSMGTPLDISGYKLSDGASERHVFPKGTIIPANGTIIVFGGGTPTGVAGLVQVASTGVLGLNNGGDTITIVNDSDALVVTETYGAAGNNQSIARNPDFTGSFIDHSSIGTNTVDFSPGKNNTDNIPFIKTWTGATDNDWATATNWLEDSTPSLTTDNVIIPSGLTNYPTASSSVTVNSAIIESGASLIAESTFNASLTVKRDLATTNWYLLGMPVMAETKTDMIANNNFASGTGSNIGLSFYDNDLVSNQWTYATAATTGSFFDIGYSVKLASAGTITAIGSMRTTNVGVSLTNGTATGFNLIGNIYPSYLAANSNANATNNLLTVNSAKLTETTIWFWNEGTDSYDQINQASDAFHIAPSQGFFVQVNSNQSFSYTEDMQSHQSTDSFQKSSSSRPRIKLFLNDGTLNRNTEIYYIEETTTGFDNGYDSSIFGGTSHEFSIFTELLSKNVSKKLGIQSLPNSNYENMVIPLGINAELGKDITISADVQNLPSGLKLFLEDRSNNTYTRLDEVNSEYKITLSETLNGVGRFYLHTTQSVLNVDDSIVLNSVSIFKTSNSNLRVTGLPKGKGSISLYNIIGKQVFTTSFKSSNVNNISLPRLTTGVYFVNLMTKKGKLNKKIILD
ncbi:lamin tail domain-containing protein [Polaribacter septentrionalilitoris]|uniref:lamin tail domain-containing protein n=1 Tax=Polaribacter septentrionalilitoris TaxID=2494657 RepID=UPI0013593A67|nr:lamin tail domain-containing protein [Polaribacter septentrionalilitoris]